MEFEIEEDEYSFENVELKHHIPPSHQFESKEMIVGYPHDILLFYF